MKKQFLVTKLVEAEEMTDIECMKFMGLEPTEEEEKKSCENAFKIYHPEGYISVLPKDTFLKTAYEIENNSITEELVKTFIRRMEISTERIFGKLSTVVKYELVNGFVGVESTSCVDETNYDEETGVNIISKKIYDKIWFGLGFALAMTNKKGEEI